MLSLAVAALAFTPPNSLMTSRREAVFAGAFAAAAMPMAAFADGSVSLVTLQKARLTYGQKVLSLVDASAEKIVEEQNAIKLYVSATERASGKKTDPRKSAANAIIAAAKVSLAPSRGLLLFLLTSLPLCVARA